MSRRTIANSFTPNPASHSDLDDSAENGSQVQASDSFGGQSHRSSSKYSKDETDRVDAANDSLDSNMTWDVNVEDLDASAEWVPRSTSSPVTSMPLRRSPRLHAPSQNNLGSSSPRRRALNPQLIREPIKARSVGVKGAKEAQQRQEKRKIQHQIQQQQQLAGILDALPSWCWVCFVLAMIVVVLLVLRPLSVWQTKEQPVSSPEREPIVKAFDVGLRKLREEFPSQTLRFWRVLKAATWAVMRLDSPREPAVLMLAITAGSRDTASCLVKHFASLVSEAYGAREALTVNASLIEIHDPQAVKLFLDETLSSHLGGGSRVAVLHQLELIPGKAVMIFHGYCDNDNAPHKDAVLLFTVELEAAPASEDDIIVEGRLSSLWERDLEVEKYTALISRMAKSVAFVMPETADRLQGMCPHL